MKNNLFEKNNIYSLRKFKVGLASVTIGGFFVLTGNSALASDELNSVSTVPAETTLSVDSDKLYVDTSVEKVVNAEEVTKVEDNLVSSNVQDKFRTAGINYKVNYVDENGKVVASKHFTVSVPTKEEDAELLLKVEAEAISGYNLKDNELAVVEKLLKEKSSNLIEFKVVSTNDTVASTERSDFRYSQSPVENEKPYITIERYWGKANTGPTPDYTVTKNGDIANVVYKVGLTRISPDQVELTPDAKLLGFTFDKVNYQIKGPLDLGSNLELRTYKIGLQSTDGQNIHAITDLTIQSHMGFVPRYDKTHTYGATTSGLPRDYTYTVSEWKRSSNYLEAENLTSATLVKDGVTKNVNTEYSSADVAPATNLTYEGMKVTATPFGYYVEDGTVEDAKPNEQYHARFTLFALDNATSFNSPLTVKEFKQTGGSEGVELEFFDKSKLDPGTFYNAMDGALNGGGSGRQYTPYIVNFKKLPATAGKYFVKFQVTDSLGLTKDYTIHFTTFERSRNGALTTADIRFDGTDDFLPTGAKHVTVPRSAKEQVLGTIIKNKDNANIIPLDLPESLEYDVTTGELKKKSGYTLEPGMYTVNFKAVDGHFAESAPPRSFTFEVTESIVEIPHQIWDEGTVITPINVTLENGTPIKSIKVIATDDNANFYTEGTNTIKGFALKRTDTNKIVRVEATYTRVDGTDVTVSTNFTYEVRANTVVQDIFLNVTNPTQSVREGENFLDMVITTSEGGTLKVDRSKLPSGVTYDENTRTISGRGNIRGSYQVPVIYEKDGKVLSKTVDLLVTPGELVAEPVVKTVQVLTKLDDVIESLDPTWSVEFADGDPFGLMFSGANIDTRTKKWTGTASKVGTYNDKLRITRRNENGTTDSIVVPVTLTITPIEHTLEVTNKEQTINIGESIETIAVTNSKEATLDAIRFPANSGLTFDETTKTITGTPTRAGVYTFEVVSKMNGDYTGNSYDYYNGIRERVTITVNPKPIFVEAEDRTVLVGKEMEPIEFTTTDGAIISFDKSRLPEGLSYDEETKTISGTPTRVGTYRLVVKSNFEPNVQDPVSKNFTITVNPIPATIEIENNHQTVQIGEPLKTVVITTNDQAILEGIYLNNILSEDTIIDFANGQWGLKYDPDTNTISGTPKAPGEYRLKLRAKNPAEVGSAEATEIFAFTVKPDEPIDLKVTNDRQLVVAGETIREISISNSDNTVLEVDESKLPEGVVYNSDSKTITGTPKRGGKNDILVKALRERDGKFLTHVINLDVIDLNSALASAVQTPDPLVNPIPENTNLVTGNGIPNATVVVTFPDGTVSQPITVTNGGTWSVIAPTLLQKGQSITAKQTETGKTPSDAINVTVVPNELVNTPAGPGTPGRDGVDGKTPSIELEEGIDATGKTGVWIIVKDGDGREVSRKFVKNGETGEQGLPGTNGTNGRDGVDGKTPKITFEPSVDSEGNTGTKVIVTNTDGSVTESFIKNGKDGKTGEQGLPGTNGTNGRDGVDGKTPKITFEPGVDSEGNTGTKVIVTNTDGSVTESFIKNGKDGANGRDGRDGVDGKTPDINAVPGVDSEGKTGTNIIISNPDGSRKTIFVKDGKDGIDGVDGKSPKLTLEPGTDNEGNTGTYIVVTNTDGSTVREFIKNGRDGNDGKTPNISVEPGTDSEGNTGTWIIVRAGDGNITSKTFIKNCGCPNKTPNKPEQPKTPDTPKEMLPGNPPVVELPKAELDSYVPGNPPVVELPKAELDSYVPGNPPVVELPKAELDSYVPGNPPVVELPKAELDSYVPGNPPVVELPSINIDIHTPGNPPVTDKPNVNVPKEPKEKETPNKSADPRKDKPSTPKKLANTGVAGNSAALLGLGLLTLSAALLRRRQR